MDRWSSMRIFVKVAEESSFAEAARKLNMSPPAVTRAVAFLEEVTGARLFIRTTRAVNLTEAGERYLRDCQRILMEISEAEAAAGGVHARPSGYLFVTAPVIFGNIHVTPILTAFLREYEGVTARTLFVDRLVNIVDEGVDVAIRIGHLEDSGLSAIRVGAVRRVLCAAPSYLAAAGIPARPAELPRHNIIAAVPGGNGVEWHFGRNGETSVSLRPRLFCNTNEAAMRAAIDGWGVARLLSYQIEGEQARDELQIVLADFEEDPLPVHVVHPEGRLTSAKTRAFVDFVVARLRTTAALNSH
ncbi:LysR family transcriptional regulator [Neorhizobium sp. Rsf11]|uniref:LysR family transcriptional regulator n=2 Tax=Neorhizobium TaxID=1525371 RepID=A0ABV0MBY5_9HYPH|nr:LysR family transcriptional regulator [Neorhizobium petrolearium]MCC2613726.1 LysR family transcriptional regulator [Neorhizobium petrolearium]WGI72038.1 LysR family transcriptional regulator [Neorhizobium petrolearium]